MTAQKIAVYQTTVREWLLSLMRDKGLSANGLAKIAGVTHTTIQRAIDPAYAFETKPQTIARISERTGVPLPQGLRAAIGQRALAEEIPTKIDRVVLRHFMKMALAKHVGEDFADRQDDRLRRMADVVALQSEAVVDLASDADRAILLIAAVQALLKELAGSSDRPSADRHSLENAARILPSILRAFGTGP